MARRDDLARPRGFALLLLLATGLVLAGCGRLAPIGTLPPGSSPVALPSDTSPGLLRQAPADSTPTRSTTPSPTPGPTQPDAAVLLAAGDISHCSREDDEATAAILRAHPDATVQTLGDNAYESGTAFEFDCYDDSWGDALGRTRPALGGRDYETPGAAGYFDYFRDALEPLGPTATDPAQGWYAYDLGQWRVIVLNSMCGEVGGCDVGSAQAAWLRSELAAHRAPCSLAVIHNPRFSSGPNGNEGEVQPFWELLHAAGTELVLSGDNHSYERLAPMTPTGDKDRATGIRQFVVGTGGRSHHPFDGPIHPNYEARDDQTFGVLKLTLHPDRYEWEFLPVAGMTFTDIGSTACH